MANKYYYLVAVLPYLKFNEEPPITAEKFLGECEKWLSSQDMEAVYSAQLHCPEGRCEQAQILLQWKSFEKNILEELANIRKAKKEGQNIKETEFLREVMQKETPLLMEKTLEKVKWNYLEEKKHGFFFDLNWLIVYFLQLQSLERVASFDKDKGENYFYELCEVNYEKAIG